MLSFGAQRRLIPGAGTGMMPDMTTRASQPLAFSRRALLATASALPAAEALAAKPKKVRPLKTWLRYAVNAEMFWSDLPFVDRLNRIADSGFPHFEFWGYEKKDIDAVAELCAARGLSPVQFVAGWGLNTPKAREKLLGSLPKAISTAKRLDVKMMTVVAGNEEKDVPRGQQTDEVVRTLQEAAKLVAPEGLTLILEPLNVLRDHPGQLVVTSQHAAEIVRAVASPHVKILFDVYHQQISEGNLSGNIAQYKDLIGYFQIADHPGRNEPFTGEINYPHVLAEIARTGIDAPIGLELRPREDPKLALAAVLKADAEARKLGAKARG